MPLIVALGGVVVHDLAVDRAVGTERADVVDQVAPGAVDEAHAGAHVAAELALEADRELVHVIRLESRLGAKSDAADPNRFGEHVLAAVPLE